MSDSNIIGLTDLVDFKVEYEFLVLAKLAGSKKLTLQTSFSTESLASDWIKRRLKVGEEWQITKRVVTDYYYYHSDGVVE